MKDTLIDLMNYVFYSSVFNIIIGIALLLLSFVLK